MSQRHSSTKRKRRQKSSKRKDYSSATLAKLKQMSRSDVQVDKGSEGESIGGGVRPLVGS